MNFFPIRLFLTITLLLVPFVEVLGEEGVVRLVKKEQRLEVEIEGQTVAHFVFRDPLITRPYFAHVKTRTGKQVTRPHPPVKGIDKVDHAEMHPGIWLSFGDINGNDYWRLKSKTEHVRFVDPSTESTGNKSKGEGRFSVMNHYLDVDSTKIICAENCSYAIHPKSWGYVIQMESEFRSNEGDLIFGDQEEMGLGIRLATPIAVDSKLGGRILDSEGRRNGAEVWGKQARWCDYSGKLEGAWVGMTLFPSPKNFRPCWSHARDYGFVAMNPFGLKAFTKAERQDIAIKKGEVLTLGYAIAIHESVSEESYDPIEADPFRDRP